MSKEYLEVLEWLLANEMIYRGRTQLPISPALRDIKHRLESIDNANPSEALECLEKLKGMEISSMPFSDEYGTQEVDLNDIRKVGSQLNTDFREYTTTIKQALLKAQEQEQYYFDLIQLLKENNMDYYTLKEMFKQQEPKHYLQWEDLEFKEKEQTMKVIFNGKEYILKYEKLKDYDVDRVRILDEFFYKYMMFHTSTKQFFNDLHLERVEK